jgi:hypothetical protein
MNSHIFSLLEVDVPNSITLQVLILSSNPSLISHDGRGWKLIVRLYAHFLQANYHLKYNDKNDGF